MTRIPMVDNSIPQVLHCTTCLLPMQYQTVKSDKFVWQCFKCGKQYRVSKDADDIIEESPSPPR